MQSMTQRSLLSSGAVGLGILAVAGCTTNPTTGQLKFSPAVIDAIQQGVATAAKFIPLVRALCSRPLPCLARLMPPSLASVARQSIR